MDVVLLLYGLLTCNDEDVKQFSTLLTKIAKVRSSSYVKLWKDMWAGKTHHQPLALAENLSNRNCQTLLIKKIPSWRGDIKTPLVSTSWEWLGNSSHSKPGSLVLGLVWAENANLSVCVIRSSCWAFHWMLNRTLLGDNIPSSCWVTASIR